MDSIDVKQAIKLAHNFLTTVFDAKELKDLRLEEVELSDDERYWYITFGFAREVVPLGISEVVAPLPEFERIYKVVQVDAETGEARSIKIREP